MSYQTNEPPEKENGAFQPESEPSDEAARKDALSGGTAKQDALSPELPVSNYVFSNDSRSLLLRQCQQAADSCAGALQRREPSDRMPAQAGGKKQPFLFDIVNCRVSDLSGSGTSTQMPVFWCADEKRPSLCAPHGIYQNHLIDCYELFQSKRKETQCWRNSILRRSLEEVIDSAKPADGCRFLCLMPDVTDDFDKELRAQLNYKGIPLFQVPRSIALAYTLQAEGVALPEAFLCLDYDGEELSAIKLRKEEDESGGHIFIREGPQDLDGRHPSTRELSNEYLKQYQNKHKLRLTKKARSDLVNTKRLQHLLFDRMPPLLLDNDGKVVSLSVDDELLDGIAKKLYDDMGQIEKNTGMTVYAMCGLFNDPNDRLYHISQMEAGCLALCEQAEQGRLLWQECLPDLRLEVNREDCFDEIQLIDEKDRHQNISVFVLNEKVKLPVTNGIITFPANGAKHYDLPLHRKALGHHAKEKLARFELEKPLQSSVQVQLTVQYQYGDTDSYQLIARSPQLEKPLYSSWVDAEGLTLPNHAPSFSEGTLEHRSISKEELDSVYNAFLAVHQKLRPPVAQFAYSSVYEKSGGQYSKYLYELNRDAPSYFSIQNFFKREYYTDKETSSISELFEKGVFSDIRRVLYGELSTQAALSVEESNVLIDNMADIVSHFGVLFTLEDPAFFDMIEEILGFYTGEGTPEIKHWASMTKYVRMGSDPHEIWECFRTSFRKKQDQKQDQRYDPKQKLWRMNSMISDLRAISGVCFQTETWIFDLYDGPYGREDVAWLVNTVIEALKVENFEDVFLKKDQLGKCNPRRLRDILELLLCLCRLKEKDPLLLDCNAQNTKKLVKRLKEIDKQLRELGEAGQLKYPFNSRLGITPPEAYSRVNPVIYALIETLSGGRQVSLVGFSEEESND